MSEEALPGLPQGDTEAEWRGRLPEELQPIAERYGRELFATVMNVNSANAQLAILHQWAQGNHSASAAVRTLATNLNQLAQAFLATKGWPPERVAEAAGELQLAASRAGNRIIVPGRTVN